MRLAGRVSDVSAVHGGVRFTTGAAAEELQQLRAVDNLYAFVASREDVPHGKEAVDYFTALPAQIDWQPALSLFHQWQQRREDGMTSAACESRQELTSSAEEHEKSPERKRLRQEGEHAVAVTPGATDTADVAPPEGAPGETPEGAPVGTREGGKAVAAAAAEAAAGGAAERQGSSGLQFRVTCHRVCMKLTKHGFSSPEAAGAAERQGSSGLQFRVTCHRICMKLTKHGFSSPEAAGTCPHLRFPMHLHLHPHLHFLAHRRIVDVLALIRDSHLTKLLSLSLPFVPPMVDVLAWIRDSHLTLLIALIYAQHGTGKTSARLIIYSSSAPPPSPSPQLYSSLPYRKAHVPTSPIPFPLRLLLPFLLPSTYPSACPFPRPSSSPIPPALLLPLLPQGPCPSPSPIPLPFRLPLPLPPLSFPYQQLYSSRAYRKALVPTSLKPRPSSQRPSSPGPRPNVPQAQALVPTSLKPSTAFALLQLADIRPGDIVLDPICVSAFGGDKDAGAVDAAATNSIAWRTALANSKALGIAAANRSALRISAANQGKEEAAVANGDAARRSQKGHVAGCDWLVWDASALPLRTGCVDRVLCDMPFGVRCGNFKMRERLCPAVIRQVARVLTPGTGLAVLMAVGRGVRAAVEGLSVCLREKQRLAVEMEGLSVFLREKQRLAVEMEVRGGG
ncbi:unnamed protein product [Closterium sp. NIES-64]|nr:unnamed protein product [Closterium sp. NIES-64]